MSGPAMLLMEATRICGWRPTPSDWPSTLTAGELEELQYPPHGTTEDKRTARCKRDDFRSLLIRDIQNGDLHTEQRPVATGSLPNRSAGVSRKDYGGVSRRVSPTSFFATPEWLDEFSYGVRESYDRHARIASALFAAPCNGSAASDSNQSEAVVHVLHPASVAAWLTSIQEEPSKLVAAWLFANSETPPTCACTSDLDNEPPDKWSRGMRAVAWEVASRLMQEEGQITGPGLFDAMREHQDVTPKGAYLVLKNGSANLLPGQDQVKDSTVKRAWLGELKELFCQSPG